MSDEHEELTRYRAVWDRAINTGCLVRMGGTYKCLPMPLEGVCLSNEAYAALAKLRRRIEELEAENAELRTAHDESRPADPPVGRQELAFCLEKFLCLLSLMGSKVPAMRAIDIRALNALVAQLEAGQDARKTET